MVLNKYSMADLMALAAIFTIVLCSFNLVGTNFGLGTHIWRLAPSIPILLHKTTRITQSLYGCYLSYATAITLTKCYIIVSYLRIFPNQSLRQLVRYRRIGSADTGVFRIRDHLPMSTHRSSLELDGPREMCKYLDFFLRKLQYQYRDGFGVVDCSIAVVLEYRSSVKRTGACLCAV